VSAVTRPFRITLEGINYFQTVNNVAYIAIKDKEPVNILALNIVKAIKDVITGYYAEMEYDYTHYIPHMTIGEKIPAYIFPEVKKRFSDYQIHREVEVTYFTLAGENNGLWKQLRTFKLYG
jgi:2'-5' RNA ligase